LPITSVNSFTSVVVYTILAVLAALLYKIIPSKFVQISPKGLSNPRHLGTLNVVEILLIVNSIKPVPFPIEFPYPHGVNG
jgi:hypothetical protein